MIKHFHKYPKRHQFGTRNNKNNPKFLSDIPENLLFTVYGINAGREVSKRLTGLGLTPGTIVRRVSSAPFNGPVQIEVRGTRLAIGRGLARKILIKPYGKKD